MRMKKSLVIRLLWAFPLFIYAADASAWGLFTHIYFAQYIAFSTPLLDPRLQKAIKNFPHLVMAGACLPDLALVSKKFKTTHQWQQAARMLEHAQSDEEIAIAIGYNNHLFVDIVAHNHFVPAFEAKWLNHSMLTHVTSEWAMDAHINQHIISRPFDLLSNQTLITAASKLLGASFNVPSSEVKKSIKRLAWADKTLRFSRLSSFLLKRISRRDDEFIPKLGYYLQQTKDSFSQFEQLLLGNMPSIRAELVHLSATEMSAWREKCLLELRLRLTTPLHIYREYHDHFLSNAHSLD
jgi:hypothetical protein